MRLLTLTQPWATLVAIGAKAIETRSWRHEYRGPLAIHAAAGLGPLGGARGLAKQFAAPHFYEALWQDGGLTLGDVEDACGKIVAVARVVGYAPTGFGIAAGETVDFTGPDGRSAWRVVTDQERAFGDYSPGRWLWMLADVRRLAEPLPYRGALGLRDLPADVAAEVERRTVSSDTPAR